MHTAASKAEENLDHSAAAVTWNAVIHGRRVIEKRIRSRPLVETGHISRWEARLEMLAEGEMNDTPIMLGRLFQHGLQLVGRSPTKEGFELVKIRK